LLTAEEGPGLGVNVDDNKDSGITGDDGSGSSSNNIN
jgi:hypothetical protein